MSASKHTPWKLIWHGNETYPYPLSIDTADGKTWITRDGTVSDKEHADLIVRAVNSHDALVQALGRLLTGADELFEGEAGALIDEREAARAALAAARGSEVKP